LARGRFQSLSLRPQAGMRVLYIHGTNAPPSRDPRRDAFSLLSEKLEGDVLHPIWFTQQKDVEEMFGPGSYPFYQARNFRFHWFLTTNTGGARRKIAAMWFYITKGLQIYRERRFDCIVSYSHMATGLCAVVLKLLTGAKLIIEITTAPDLVFAVKKQKPSLQEWIMRLYSYLCLHICLWTCDRAQLRGPGLIARYRMLRNVPTSILVGFVPVSTIPRHAESGERTVILVGAPWYLKGADVLIEAFLRLSGEFPDVKLKLLGYYPDREPLDALIGGSPQIEILKARSNPEALELISKALIFVLPSRCEGTPRVVVEAMAAGVPVIGSDVGAIPYLIRDGENGFVVPAGDASALEARLRQLLSDPELRRAMGERGYALAHSKFSEQAYVEQFTRAVTEVVSG
jgi:glycosyltransferase involved in cell wall biosynthesis